MSFLTSRIVSHLPSMRQNYEAVETFPRRRHRIPSNVFLGVNLVFFLGYVGVFAYAVRDMLCNRHEAGLIYSPGRPYVTYEAKLIDESAPSEFGGRPSLPVDAAWHRLLTYNNLVLSEEDLRHLDETSVSLRDGSGHLGTLSIIHQLHCVNYVREYAFPEYYNREGGRPGIDHIYHCVDNIRKIIMCHADITPRTFEWDNNFHEPVMKPQSTRECRNWEKIVQFAKDYSPSLAHGATILENPVLGPVFAHEANKTQAK